jgi:hypothetical protein
MVACTLWCKIDREWQCKLLYNPLPVAGKQQRSQKINWPGAFRDITLRLIGTGQLPIGIFGAVVILMVWKTPDEQMGQAWATLNLFIEARSGLGYSLAGLLSVGWLFHSRFQRKNAERELRRLSGERTSKQQKYFRQRLESSEDQ